MTHLISQPTSKLQFLNPNKTFKTNLPKPIPLHHLRKTVPFNVNDFLTLSRPEYEKTHDCKLPELTLNQDVSPSTSTTRRDRKHGKTLDQSFMSGEWITPSNFTSRQQGLIDGIDEENLTLGESSVGCITLDYHMQNAMIQMGLRVLSLNGKSIRNIRYWMKRCYGCFKFVNDTEAVFFPKNGRTVYRFSRRDRQKRGKTYSIPKPKGG